MIASIFLIALLEALEDGLFDEDSFDFIEGSDGWQCVNIITIAKIDG
jgi:hypothetical protein